MVLDQSRPLPDDALAPPDQAAMGVSLDVRTPDLNRELAAFAWAVSGSSLAGTRARAGFARSSCGRLPESPRGPRARLLRCPQPNG
jgi:hypothetical protein